MAKAGLLAGVMALFWWLPASAQDGCKAATQSCSQMARTCESRCQASAHNSGRCAALCASSIETCRSTGVWKTGMSAGCWRTSNRS